jgi:triacylglycerol esterase/lipase EstA (alpha/beta hydrolase family)
MQAGAGYMTRLLALLGLLFAAAWSLIPPVHAQQRSGYIKHDPSRKEVIVFVHGVIGDAKDTWTNAQTRSYWPALVRDDSTFSDANVWIFSYSSPRVDNAQNIEELARKLGDELRAQDVFQSHQRLYFLVHSMGGLGACPTLPKMTDLGG